MKMIDNVHAELLGKSQKTLLPQVNAMGLAGPAAAPAKAGASPAAAASGGATHTLTAPTQMPGYKKDIPSDITHKLVAPSKGGGGDYKPPEKKAAAAPAAKKAEPKKADAKKAEKKDEGPTHAISNAPSKRTHDLGKSPSVIKAEKAAKEKKK